MKNTFEPVGPKGYRCYHCAEVNDDAHVEWCLCTGGDHTLVCARCGKCFCDAPAAVRQDFWRAATPELVARRRDHRSTRKPATATEAVTLRPAILLVDDDPIVHAVVTRVLAASGFAGTLLHAHDGRAGLQLAQSALPDLVLTDALLPKLDGRDIARTLKADRGTKHIKVAIMTALYKGTRYRLEALRDYHADRFLEKPVSAETLRNVIAELLPVPQEAVAS
jgi:CheY-like chemotaxis protein